MTFPFSRLRWSFLLLLGSVCAARPLSSPEAAERLAALEAKIQATAAELNSLQTEVVALRAAMATETPPPAAADRSRETVVAPPPARPPSPAPASAQDRTIGRFPDAAVVTAGTWPQSITIPGTTLAMRIGGFAQADLIVDEGDMATPDIFFVRAIDEQTARDEFLVTARATRLNLEVRGELNARPFRVFAEADFRGETGNELISNSTNLRLRHAFGQYGDFYAGQWWSAFTNVQAFPETVDIISPVGKPVTRQAGVRYAPWVTDAWRVGLSLENPEADVFQLPQDPGDSLDLGPDLIAFARYQHERGHIRLALLGRQLGWTDGQREAETLGYGASLTLRQHMPWRGARDNVVFGVHGGEGIGRYLVNLAGGGFDAVPSANDLETLWAWAAYGGYQHWWSPRWRSTVTFGTLALESQPGPAATQLRRLSSGTLNLFWNPHPRVTFGGELLYGVRESRDGATASAARAHFLARFGF